MANKVPPINSVPTWSVYIDLINPPRKRWLRFIRGGREPYYCEDREKARKFRHEADAVLAAKKAERWLCYKNKVAANSFTPLVKEETVEHANLSPLPVIQEVSESSGLSQIGQAESGVETDSSGSAQS